MKIALIPVQVHDVKALVDQDGCPGQQTHRLMLEMLSHLVKVS